MIYLMRHGETLWNSENRLQGQMDSPLTARGQDQVRAVARLLREEIGDPTRFAVISSPLGRARHSAELACGELGLPPEAIREDARLKEVAFGRWEGLTFDEIAARDPERWRQRQRDRWGFVVPGGESYAQLSRRAGAWFAEQDAEARLIVVCHGGVRRVLRGAYARLPEAEIPDLPEPHGSAFRLAGGTFAEFAAEPG